MRIPYIITVVALMSVFIAGCSKSSANLPSGAKNLGAIELAENTPTNFTLDYGKGCTVTGRQVSGGIAVQVEIQITNLDGTVVRFKGDGKAVSGKQCAIKVGDIVVGLTPSLKTP